MGAPPISLSYRDLFAFIWRFLRRQPFVFTTIFLVSFVWSIDNTIWPYILRLFIDIFTQFNEKREAAWSALKWPIIYGLFLWIIVEIGFRCQGFLLARALPKLEADIRMTMFDHVQRHSPKYFNEHFAGSLANKISDMTAQVSHLMQQLLVMFIPAIGAFLIAIVFFANINPLFAVLLTLWVSLHSLICIIFARNCDKYEHAHSEVRSSLLGKIVDSLTNNFAVNLFYSFQRERAIIGKYQQEEQEKNRQAKRYVEKMRLLLSFCFFTIGFIGLNGFMLYFWIKGKITTGEITQIFYTQWTISMLMWITGSALPMLFQSFGIAKQALGLMYDPQDITDTPLAKPLSISKGEIVFDSVSFQYGEKKLFQNKDVTIHGGEKVGLVGYSGAGKSTFVNLILRFYPLSTGKILIDGQEIAHVTLESLRNQVALIPQDPLLFHRSLEENIRFGQKEVTKEQVIEAAKLAHCDAFISKLPSGYDTVVGERGTKLSGGERQRVAIARAILADAPILILDEATSSLDSITEKYIQQSLEKLMLNRTTIVIAHRLSTLAQMDRILVFDQGKIVEQGSHVALLEKGGHYFRMWSMQAGGFMPDTPK